MSALTAYSCDWTSEHLSNYHKNHPNQHKKSHRLCDEIGYPVFSLLESQWKLRQQHDQSFPMEEKPLKNRY